MDLLQETHKEVSLKHTGIKQEPYSAAVQDTHINHLQQDISQIQMDIQIVKESITHPQYAAPSDTNPIALQQQLSKMEEDIKHLQQAKGPNVYLTPPGNYRSFQTTDSLVICQRCNRVGHFAHACPANLPPPRAPTVYQTYRLQENPHVTRITNTTIYLRHLTASTTVVHPQSAFSMYFL